MYNLFEKYLQNSLRIELNINIFEHKINRTIYGTSFIILVSAEYTLNSAVLHITCFLTKVSLL